MHMRVIFREDDPLALGVLLHGPRRLRSGKPFRVHVISDVVAYKIARSTLDSKFSILKCMRQGETTTA
jgi:hypothetical protein